MNKTSASEWLRIASHDLQSAKILFNANHYTDSIGNDLQQALEKILKSFFAYQNKKIPKTHDLLELYEYISEIILLEENQIILLVKTTEYFKEDRYPNPNYSLPPREEIQEVLEFTEYFFNQTLRKLNIDENSLS